MSTKLSFGNQQPAGFGGFGDDPNRNADAKQEILTRIRNAQQLSNAPEHVEAIREYRTQSDPVSYTHLRAHET